MVIRYRVFLGSLTKFLISSIHIAIAFFRLTNMNVLTGNHSFQYEVDKLFVISN